MRMQSPEELKKSRKRALKAMLAFLAVSAFMYVSIMYKIVHYGP